MSEQKREERKDFEKVSVMLPPEVAERLKVESARRKSNGEVNWSICAIIREAINRGLPEAQRGADWWNHE